ncbi:MAG: serine/threonine-protein kinase [Pseudomonadota bacterium]
MEPGRWESLQDLFTEALDRPEADRSRFISSAIVERGLDPTLGSEVLAMLAAHGGPPLELEQLGEEPSVQLPESIGAYRVISLIGQGGMGEVLLAERDDKAYQRQVAIKVLRSRREQAGWAARFRREQSIHARLDHPNIARLLDAGIGDDGLPYFVMEYVAGDDILTHAASQALDLRERVQLIIQVCRAMAFAHQRLILHRDIKPSNILVGPDGQTKLLDFGIAKILDDEGENGELTQTGERLMTPRYASPEQIRGESLTVASDVFQLGVVLFELATGKRPFDAPSDYELSERIVRDDTAAPTRAFDGSSLPRDLQAVLLQALAREPGDRYAGVDALASDLECFLEHRPVQARRPNALDRFRKLWRRHPASVSLAGLAVAAIVLGGSLASWQAGRAADERDRARAEAQRANAALERAERSLERAERSLRIQESYGDLLHRSFGGEGNADRMSQILLERWQEAQQNVESDPVRAAEISFAVGRNFLERNDYVRAAEVLGAWVEAGYGDGRLLLDGKLNLGVAYRYLGRFDDAEPLLREAQAAFENGIDRGSYDHVLAVQVLSESVDSDQQDALRSELRRLTLGALDDEPSVEEAIYFTGVLSRLHMREADYAAAADYSDQTIELLEAHPLVEVAGRDSLWIGKIIYDLFLRNNLEAAERGLKKIESDLRSVKGDSQNTVFVLGYRGEIAARREDLAGAVAFHEQAEEVALQQAEAGTSAHIYAASYLAQTLAVAGRIEEATAKIAELEPLVQEKFGGRHRFFVLAKAKTRLLRDGPAAASSILAEIGMTRRVASSDIIMQTFFDQLVEAGVEPPA